MFHRNETRFFLFNFTFFSNLLAKKLKTEQILLEGPIINPKEEISGMDWYKEHLFLLPENQNNYLYVIPKKEIYKSLNPSNKIKILPRKITLSLQIIKSLLKVLKVLNL